jgi:phosphatidate cytidylyltransferase
MALGNTSQRIVVAIIAIPFILFSCVYGEYLFLVFAGLIALISFYEFSLMTKVKHGKTNLLLGFLSISILLLNKYFKITEIEYLVIGIIITHLIAELFRNKGSEINNLGASLLGIFYIGFFSTALLGIREFYPLDSPYYNQGGFIIIGLLITIWVCDSAAFFLGVAFGKHKIFPRVSPKKSWEGSIAGFIFAILTMIANKAVFMDFLRWQDVFAFGIIVGILGQIGDLIESLIKRDADVKDSSALIPGHGGIFDRFDSLLFTAPVIYLYMIFLLN